MISAVLDSNVLASGFVRPQSVPGELLRLWSGGAFELVISAPIVAEVSRTLEKPYFAQRLTRAQRTNNIRLMQTEARLSAITTQVEGVASHPEDDLVLATAVSVQADFLVTGDIPFRQRVPSYRAVRLVSPREFLDLLEPENPSAH